ncbi:MAG: 3-dehydroquinate synthase [Candidatus Omnitrophica bacterium]|nr:3-dehydroquinate synthase [Candidatus Omnitrophota bacterium]
MKTIKVNLGKRSYNIIIGTGIINSIGRIISGLSLGKDAYIITNKRIKDLYGKDISSSLSRSGFNFKFKLIQDSEKSKSLENACVIIKDLALFARKKNVCIIAMGGGVAGDLAGFVAAVFKRGIPYIQIPTTLLAQVDSAIGGKTAVDLKEGKNLVGAFYQPRAVISDTGLLTSLNKRHIRSGLAEIIKYAIIKDKNLFSYLENNLKGLLNLKPSSLEHVITASCKIKASIVEQDEREERGIRTILNFGHTIGHAIETASNYDLYSHGEAIALGMLTACAVSKKLGLINASTVKRIDNLIKASGLPTKIRGTALNKIIYAHYFDKKFIGKKNRFILIDDIGKAKVKEAVSLEIIKEAVKERL